MMDPVNGFLVVTVPTCDGPIYLPSFVLRPSAKPRRASRKRTVPTMASEITSASCFVSTMRSKYQQAKATGCNR
jgi:hypothetical protein